MAELGQRLDERARTPLVRPQLWREHVPADYRLTVPALYRRSLINSSYLPRRRANDEGCVALALCPVHT